MFDLILDSVEDFHTVEERRLHRIFCGLERTGIGLRHLAAIELGEKNPSTNTLLRLIRSMGAPSDRVVYPELFTGDSVMDRISRLAATCSPKQRRLIVAFIEMLLSQEYTD